MANIKKGCNCSDQEAYAIFKVKARGSAWGSIVGNIELQKDLMDLFNKCFKIDNVTTSGSIQITENEEDNTYNIGTQSFEFIQEEPSNTWIIEHEACAYPPDVICVDETGRQFFGEVVYTTATQVVVLMNKALKGKAFLNVPIIDNPPEEPEYTYNAATGNLDFKDIVVTSDIDGNLLLDCYDFLGSSQLPDEYWSENTRNFNKIINC